MTAPERILVVGSGAREHALAWRLAGEPDVSEVHVAPGNPGMSDVAAVHSGVGLGELDGLVELALALETNLVVVGPEAPIAAGLADRLSAAGVAVFGPSRAAAALESSKSFCRSIAEAARIPMAEGASFDRSEDAIAFARRVGGALVVKADGLAAGKGVTVCETVAEAEAAIRAAIEGATFGEAGRRVVVERRLYGREASLMVICDGTSAVALPPARDHKRVGDTDTGPNTGGMGAYSPLADLADDDVDELVERFHRPVLAEMARRGTPFRGLLYAGLMLTDEGPRLLEFNVRFGDPEAQAVLPRVDGALAALLLAAARGDLGSVSGGAVPGGSLIKAASGATVAVVIAAAGYPSAPRTGDPIDGLAEARAAGALVFHAAIAIRHGWPVTAGGRVLTVVGRGRDVAAAREQAYRAAEVIRFTGMHRRSDIGVPVAELAGMRA